ncbi:MAG: ribonuclease III [Phocaeicola sp.]
MFENITNKIRLLFRKNKESYLCFYRILGFLPKDIRLYEQAVLHKSLSIKSEQGGVVNNERLEFLGDAILDAIVADILYKKYEGKREGFLTNTRSKIVQRETLNQIAIQIGLDKLIKYASKQMSHNNYMCGNAFEALIGAIYLDKGYRVCKTFMEERIIGQYLNLEDLSRRETNFKSKLIEWTQKNRFEISFELVEETKEKDSSPIFVSEVWIEEVVIGRGTGHSKKESQQIAAAESYKKIKGNLSFIRTLEEARAERNRMATSAEIVDVVTEEPTEEPTPAEQ